MNKVVIGVIAAVVVLGGVVYFLASMNKGTAQIEYEYSPVTKGTLIKSTPATGVLAALTQVDIKSKAGGTVTKLYVKEGDIVKPGDKIAEIDPTDTQDAYDQANAGLSAARDSVANARVAYDLELKNDRTAVADATEQVRLAEIALERAKTENSAAPALSQADLRTAQANLDQANQSLAQLTGVTIPQREKDYKANVDKAQVALDTAKADQERQHMLYEKGYVALSAVQTADSTYQNAQAALVSAQQTLATLQKQDATDIATSKAKVRVATASLAQSRANTKSVPEAELAYRQALATLADTKVALQKTIDARLNASSKKIAIESAQANMVNSQVATKNAKVQLDSTRVVAPRAGVVTTKYLEEGTIIPPGTSTFAQGTSIVQISDVSRMFVDCPVDETDIGTVKVGQDVNIVLQAYPRKTFPGQVRRVFPGATTANGVTTIEVEVEVLNIHDKDAQRHPLRPGMNANCDFIIFKQDDALIVPTLALNKEGDKTYVLVKTADPKKPEKHYVTVGRTGNDGVIVSDGIKEGDQVVTATLDYQAMRDRQARITQNQQGNQGLGGQQRGGPSQSLRSGGTGGSASGGASRAGGGGGGR